MKKKVKINEKIKEVTNAETDRLKLRIEKLETQVDNLEQELSAIKNNAWSFRKILQIFYK